MILYPNVFLTLMRYFFLSYRDISLAVPHCPSHILSFFARPQKLGTELQRINEHLCIPWILSFEWVTPVCFLEFPFRGTPIDLNFLKSSCVRCSPHRLSDRAVYSRLDNSQIQQKPQLSNLKCPCPGTLPALHVDLDNRLWGGVPGRIPRGGK